MDEYKYVHFYRKFSDVSEGDVKQEVKREGGEEEGIGKEGEEDREGYQLLEVAEDELVI